MLYIVLAIFSLHIISLPIVIGAAVSIDSDTNNGRIKIKLFFIPVFVKKIDIERIKSIINKASENKSEEKETKNSERDSNDKGKSRLKKFLINVAKSAILRVRVRYSSFQMRLGTGDAAVSAVTTGAIAVAYSQICAVLGYDGESAEIVPDYNNECIFVDFSGIFSLCFADIIYAVCAAVIKSITSGTRKRRDYANTTVAE